ncbi:MAG: GAF domain-containing SpoIIE family protein phosphatase [Woeseia sp.]
MYRLAAPGALPRLLREIVEVGKVAIVAEAGILWLMDRQSGELVMVVPATDDPARLRPGHGLVGECAASGKITNIPDVRDNRRTDDWRSPIQDFEARSLLNVPILGQENSLLGVMQWLGTHPGQFDRHDEWIGPALAAQAAIAIQHSNMTDRLLADAILHHEVAVAREIQVSTLPEVMPQVPGYDVHGQFLPTQHTGGDLYDLVVLDGRLFMLLGDATGHGFGPALSATQMQAMLRVAFRLGADLDSAYMHVNNQLNEDLPDDRFITAFMGFLDPVSHEVEFHSGGQGPILHFHALTDECEWQKPTNFPVGIMPLDGTAPARRLQLQPGDVLALISDGLYEYATPDGRLFGEDGVATVLRQGRDLPMAELSRKLVQAAFEFGSGAAQADDITLVLVKRQT